MKYRYIETLYIMVTGDSEDMFRMEGLPPGWANCVAFTKPEQYADLYKEIVKCIPREEFIKALLLGHGGAIRARRYLEEDK